METASLCGPVHRRSGGTFRRAQPNDADGCPAASTGELRSHGCDVFALEARAIELDLARLALALAAGDGRRPIGAAANNLIQRHLSLEAVWQADDCQAEMQQIGDD